MEGKVVFLRAPFVKAGMDAPREIRAWFTAGQPIKRETAFLIGFVLGLDGGETDECYMIANYSEYFYVQRYEKKFAKTQSLFPAQRLVYRGGVVI